MKPDNNDEVTYTSGSVTRASDENVLETKKDIISGLDRVFTNETNEEKYLLAKPKRVIITAKIIHDQDN